MAEKNFKVNIFEGSDNTVKTECLFLCAALNKTEFISEADTDWNAVFEDLYSQTSETIPGNYLNSLGLEPGLKMKWKMQSMKRLNDFYRIMEAQDALVKLLNAHNIKFAILKGSAASMYYPEPQYRAMGDIDFLVEPERFDEAFDILKANGFTDGHAQFSRHEQLFFNGCELEMHKYFSLKGDSDELNEIDYIFFDGLQHTETKYIENHAFPVLPPLQNGLILLQHLKHHLRRSLGLRQIADWMMYVKNVLTDEMWSNSFKAEADKAGLTQLAVTVTRMCQMALGLDESITWCKDADERLCKQLFEHVILSGNMGSKRKEDKVQTSIDQNRGFFNVFRKLQQNGLRKWVAAKEHKILRPLAWLWMLFHYLNVARKNNISVKKIISSGKSSLATDKMFEELGCPDDLVGE